jgi:hypothetical protein
MQGLDLLKKGKTYNVTIWNDFYEKLITWEYCKFLYIYEDLAFFNTTYRTSSNKMFVLHIEINDSRNSVKLV